MFSHVTVWLCSYDAVEQDDKLTKQPADMHDRQNGRAGSSGNTTQASTNEQQLLERGVVIGRVVFMELFTVFFMFLYRLCCVFCQAIT